jgi:hypothetical protein
MSVHPTPTELGDFAFEVLERPGPNEWFALVTPVDGVQQAADALQSELLAIDEVELAHLHVRTADEILELVRARRTGVLLLSVDEALGPLEWQKLDEARSRLQRDGSSVFILGEEGLGQLFRHAPNLSSWIGGSVWSLERQNHALSAREKQERLESLRQWSGMTDEDVLTRAEQGTLPGDPPYAEWLVLLGRGDLLGKQ